MHASVLVLGAVLSTQALAAHRQAVMPAFGKRQTGEAFDPIEDETCPSDWPICGNSNFCYNTAEDYICCPGQEHVCPPGSYCLQNPYCCPDGLDPETCAEEFGITLDPTPTATSTASTSTPVIPTTTSSATSTPTSSSAVPPTGTETETPEVPEFTGAANAKIAGSAAALLGWVGIFGNLLI